jgi:DNA-binding transcriptional LysR family regulator
LSIIRAARELYVTPSSVSHDLKRLQKTLGYDLIKRTRRGIDLTEVGSAFLPEAEALLARFVALKTRYVPTGSKQPEEFLRLGASHGMSTSLMPLLMARFKETHPAANLRLYTETSREIENLLLKGDLNLGIATNPKRFPALHMEPFRSAVLCALVPANHRLAKMKVISLRELAKMPLVIRSAKEGGSRTALLLKKCAIAVSSRILPSAVARPTPSKPP